MYVQGRDFNCKGSSCYGIGLAAQVITNVQQAANTALSLLKIPLKVTVDGKIGPATVSALLEIAKRAPGDILAVIQRNPTPAIVAQYASELVAELTAIPPSAGIRPPPSPVPPVAQPTISLPVPQVPVPQTQVPVAVPTSPIQTTVNTSVPRTMPVSTTVPAAPPVNDYRNWWIAAGAVAIIGTAVAVGVYAHARLSGSR